MVPTASARNATIDRSDDRTNAPLRAKSPISAASASASEPTIVQYVAACVYVPRSVGGMRSEVSAARRAGSSGKENNRTVIGGEDVLRERVLEQGRVLRGDVLEEDLGRLERRVDRARVAVRPRVALVAVRRAVACKGAARTRRQLERRATMGASSGAEQTHSTGPTRTTCARRSRASRPSS